MECSGDIRVKEDSELNYFGDPDSTGAESYLITMAANDGHTSPSAQPQLKVRVTVANVDEPPNVLTSSCSISEAAEPGTPICSLAVRRFAFGIPPELRRPRPQPFIAC